MSDRPSIYLDNAATSFPKPESVYSAVDNYQRHSGQPYGRGTSRSALATGRLVDAARWLFARLIQAETGDRIIFTFNGTDSLNLVIRGLLAPGGHVVTTAAEHNSVLRPLRQAHSELAVESTILPVDAEGFISPSDVDSAIRPGTQLVAVTHASNVTGTIQPIAEIGAICRKRGIPFLVDAAQTAGHVPIDVREAKIDLLACSGHKGLLGPLGTGLLYLHPGLEERIRPLRTGGTGTQSESDQQPAELPARYESGNHNVPGLVGLHAGLQWIADHGLPELRRKTEILMDHLKAGLAEIPGLTYFGPRDTSRQSSVVSCQLTGYDPQELAGILDEEFAIQIRAGLHCAPRMHAALGTASSGGTIRISPGHFSTTADVEALLAALRAISGYV